MKQIVSRVKPYRLLIFIWAISVTLFIFSAWPGWVSGDTIMMYQQAVSRQISDWHTPILTFMWSRLKPTVFGPIIPFLLQSILFWIGILLLTIWAFGKSNKWALILPPLALLLESTWVIAWVWKDSATVAIIVFAAGLLLFLNKYESKKPLFIGYLLSSFLLGFAVSLRWYMAPSLCLLWFGISVLAIKNLHKGQSKTFKAVTLKNWILGFVIFCITGVGTNVFVYQVIKPAPLYPISGTMLLDISRVACNPEENSDLTNSQSYFPTSLIHIVDNRPLCEFYNPVDFGSLWGWPSIPPEHSYYSVPSNPAEMNELQSKWISVVKSHPKALLIGRLQQAYFFLNSDAGFFYNPADKIEDHIPWSGRIGEGATIGWPNNDSLLIALVSFSSATFSALSFGLAGSQLGLAWILFFPFVAGWLLYRKIQRSVLSFLPLLLFPTAWLFNFAVAALAEDERYMLPAIVVGQLILVFAVFYKPRAMPVINQAHELNFTVDIDSKS